MLRACRYTFGTGCTQLAVFKRWRFYVELEQRLLKFTDMNTYHRISDINNSCLTEFRKHWACLEQNNQQLWQCRRPERKLNACVFEKIVSSSPNSCKLVPRLNSWPQNLEKTIPGTPAGEIPVHLRERQIYSNNP